jgi:hypothetical protein
LLARHRGSGGEKITSSFGVSLVSFSPHKLFGVVCAGGELEMDMNSGWLGFSLSSSAADRGYGDGDGGGEGGGSGGGSCSSPADAAATAAAGSPVVGVPLHSAGSVQYDGQGN